MIRYRDKYYSRSDFLTNFKVNYIIKHLVTLKVNYIIKHLVTLLDTKNEHFFTDESFIGSSAAEMS